MQRVSPGPSSRTVSDSGSIYYDAEETIILCHKRHPYPGMPNSDKNGAYISMRLARLEHALDPVEFKNLHLSLNLLLDVWGIDLTEPSHPLALPFVNAVFPPWYTGEADSPTKKRPVMVFPPLPQNPNFTATNSMEQEEEEAVFRVPTQIVEYLAELCAEFPRLRDYRAIVRMVWTRYEALSLDKAVDHCASASEIAHFAVGLCELKELCEEEIRSDDSVGLAAYDQTFEEAEDTPGDWDRWLVGCMRSKRAWMEGKAKEAWGWWDWKERRGMH